MPRYSITHTTSYHFDEPVDGLSILCCLNPLQRNNQQLNYHKVICTPLPKGRKKSTDEFGNVQQQLTFNRPLQKVEITSVMNVEVNELSVDVATNSSDISSNDISDRAPLWSALFGEDDLEIILTEAKNFAPDLFNNLQDPKKSVQLLMNRINEQFTYDTTATEVDTPLTWLFRERTGVCQDFARVMIAVLQANNIEARYVSGYLYGGVESDPNIIRQPASHAWVSVLIPETGWVDIDPTNNQWVDETYITLAWGRDYVDVIPVKGLLNDNRRQRIKVSVTIEKQKEAVSV
jgi:transglutaminase-like putative cysteine protease